MHGTVHPASVGWGVIRWKDAAYRQGVMEERQRQESRKHIFVVNGTPAFLNLMRDLLQDERYNVTTTNFVPRSYEQIAALQPDAMVIDVVIGQQAGWDLLERLHAEAATTGIPIIVVSTSPQLLERAQEQADRFGTHRYLGKPFDLGEMLEVVKDLIGDA